ncbi:hypothetical protein HMPREF9062_0550 [Actinomyces sp. oral taxon 448 str. F0400]|nr:hypothetical protein HMPREF9062_0550 [Actinomyces sp. oral taxon 448 str. F0400]
MPLTDQIGERVMVFNRLQVAARLVGDEERRAELGRVLPGNPVSGVSPSVGSFGAS